MFKQARVSLTGWYLLIIMSISLAFSLGIYRVLTFELDRFANLQRERIEKQLVDPGNAAPQFKIQGLSHFPHIELELIKETKGRLAVRLLTLNGIIFVFAGGLGYVLAGRTLRPIQKMHEEQKRFISDASHELRTPLTALRMSTEVALRDKRLRIGEARQVLTENIDEVDRLQYLTDNLLKLSQYDTQQLEFQQLKLSTVVTIAVKQVKNIATKKSIKINKKISEATFAGSEASLIQVLIILLENAVKYSEADSEIMVTAGLVKKQILITVADIGIGMTKDDKKHIFDRFYRSDVARSKQQGNGYGLGLSIAKQIIDLHQGTIAVTSAIGKGTTFTLKLPAKLGP